MPDHHLLFPRRFIVTQFMSPSYHSSPSLIHINKVIFFSVAAVFLVVGYFVFDYLAHRFRPFRQQSQQPDRRDSELEDTCLIELRVIPVKVYLAPSLPPNERDGGMEAENCPVCLGEYIVGEELRVLPICRHVFHRECIDRCLLTKSLLSTSSSLSSSSFSLSTSCPVCRRSIIDPEMAAAPLQRRSI